MTRHPYSIRLNDEQEAQLEAMADDAKISKGKLIKKLVVDLLADDAKAHAEERRKP